MIKYYVCALGYDENDCITDYEQYLGDFDIYEEAYTEFTKFRDRDPSIFFRWTPNIYKVLVQLEECEVDNDEISCIDVKNELWIINPNFEEVE